jgi:photosystem II stability/assembly factor-like uncharacterized protein
MQMNKLFLSILLTAFSALASSIQFSAFAGGEWDVRIAGRINNAEIVSFADADNGIIAGTGGKGIFGQGENMPPIVFSNDGGKNWTPSWIDRPEINGISCAQMLDKGNCFAIGSDKEGMWLLKSVDGGKKWNSSLLPKEIKATQIRFFSPLTGMIFSKWPIGNASQLQQTVDGGVTWTQIDISKSLPEKGWRASAFLPLSMKEFYLCNLDWFLHTADGGITFKTNAIAYKGGRELSSISSMSVSPDKKVIYIVGGQADNYLLHGWRAPKRSIILKSPDGGVTWVDQSPDFVNNMRCVHAVSADEAWAGGFGAYGFEPWRSGILLHTDDGGKTWKDENPSQMSIRGLCFLDKDTFWAVGGQGGSPHETSGGLISHRPESEGERLKGHISISYKMPSDGYASIAIVNEKGRQVRTLLAHAFRKAGAQTDMWDGLDDDGLPVIPGEYKYKILTHKGLKAELLTCYNCPNDPPYSTPDGKGSWAGDHGAPTSVVAAGEIMILGFSAGEALPAIIEVGLDGMKNGILNKSWPLAIASDGKYAYTISEEFAGHNVGTADHNAKNDSKAKLNTKITRWEVATGRYAYFEKQEASKNLGEWTIDQGKAEKFLSQRIKDQDFPVEFSGHTCNNVHIRTTNSCGIACGDGKVFVSRRKDDKILILDSATCAISGEIKVTAPVGLAWLDGALYAVTEDKILEFRDLAKAGKPVVQGLDCPFGLAAAGGKLYVSEWGRSMRVKSFDLKGKALTVFGKEGGRPWLGKYDPSGMLKPRGLAVDKNGRLWVAENDEPLKRISVWNPDGSLYKDLIGAGRYACFSWMYPDDPTTAYANIYGVSSFKVDLEKKTWKPDAILFRDGFDPHQLVNIHPFFNAKAKDGRTLFLGTTRSSISTISEMREKLLHPILAVGWAPLIVPPDIEKGWNQPLNPVKRKQRTDFKKHGAFYDELAAKICLWTDKNRDGLYQEDEFKFTVLPGWDTTGVSHNPPGTTNWGQWISPDLTIYLVTNWQPGQVWRWPLSGWDEQGQPIYKTEDIKLVLTRTDKNTGAVTVGPSGSIIMESDLSGWSAGGEKLWAYPKHWPGMAFQAPFGKPGLVVGTQALCGWVDDMFMVTGYFGQFNILTEDGLYVDQLLNDGRCAGTPGPYTISAENFSGVWLREQKSGKVLLLAGSAGESRIYQISGIETISRNTGNVKLSEGDVVKARTAAKSLSKAKDDNKPKSGVIVKVAKPLSISGELDVAWKAIKPVAEVKDSDISGYNVRIAHDGSNLYLAYEVFDNSPMLNSGNDFRMLFKSGDCVDLMLGTDCNPHNAPVAGDLRLLMSLMDAKPAAVLYRPVKLAGQEPAPAKFASPSRSVDMERVTLEPDVKFNILRREGFYLLKAQIPFSVLGVKYAPGAKLRGDFGAVYSDPSGSVNAFRSFWSNRDPSIAIINDVPSEAALKPAGWADLIME